MRLSRAVFLVLAVFGIYRCDDGPESIGTPPVLNFTETNTYGGSNNDSAQSVVATNDGGYAILGFTQSNDGDITTDKTDESFDYWVVKFSAQNTIEWQHTYGGLNNDRGQTIIQTQDGGYAMIGSSDSNDGDVSGNNGAQDFWLAKLDTQGNLLWQKTFGFQGNDIGISVIQTNDAGYLLTGILDVTASGGQGNTSRLSQRHAGGDYWAVKVDAFGELQWSQYFGGNFTDTPEGIAQTDDNGFIVVGGSDSADTDISSNIGSYDFWVIRIDENGNLVWEKSFGGEEIDEAKAITKTSDGNYMILGETRSTTIDVSSNSGAADLWLIKISPNGDLIWEKTFGGTSFDVGRSIAQTQDNGFLLAGSSRSSDGDVSENKGQNDAWAIKVNAEGNLQWEASFGGSNIDFAYGIAQLNDGSVVVVGDTTSNDGDISENQGFSDALIFRRL